jgi:hypothetical protein
MGVSLPAIAWRFENTNNRYTPRRQDFSGGMHHQSRESTTMDKDISMDIDIDMVIKDIDMDIIVLGGQQRTSSEYNRSGPCQ